MKKIRFKVLVLILFVTSCSLNKNISSYWITYLEAKTENNFLASKDNHLILNNLHLLDFENNLELNSDSVLITTKNGKKFRGLVSKTDFDGYFIKIENNREIYISNLEIKTIKFLESSSNTNLLPKTSDTLPKKNSNVQSNTFTKSKTPSNSSTDVWDNTNAEFEQPAITNNKKNVKESTFKKTQEPLSIISFLLLLLTPLLGFTLFLAFIFSIVSINKIKKNPEKYNGKRLAKATLIISTIILAIGLLLALLLIALLGLI